MNRYKVLWRRAASRGPIFSPVYSITFRLAGMSASAWTPHWWIFDLPARNGKQQNSGSILGTGFAGFLSINSNQTFGPLIKRKGCLSNSCSPRLLGGEGGSPRRHG